MTRWRSGEPLRKSPRRDTKAYLFVGQNPFSATVDERGHFVIPNVPPGDYEFQLQAWSGAAWNSNGANLRLSLQPFFTETRAFQILLLLIGLTLLWLAYRGRVGRLNAQRRELQR